MKPTISEDFPAKPTPEQLTEAVRVVTLALLYTWTIEPLEGENSATRQQKAELLGMDPESPELECLNLFDEWGNDLMCMAPTFGMAYKAPEWDGQQEEGSWVSHMKEPAKLFVPPPQPVPNSYWSLDEARWVEYDPTDHNEAVG